MNGVNIIINSINTIRVNIISNIIRVNNITTNININGVNIIIHSNTGVNNNTGVSGPWPVGPGGAYT